MNSRFIALEISRDSSNVYIIAYDTVKNLKHELILSLFDAWRMMESKTEYERLV